MILIEVVAFPIPASVVERLELAYPEHLTISTCLNLYNRRAVSQVRHVDMCEARKLLCRDAYPERPLSQRTSAQSPKDTSSTLKR